MQVPTVLSGNANCRGIQVWFLKEPGCALSSNSGFLESRRF